MTLVKENLGCDVFRSPTDSEGSLCYNLSKTEIDHLEISILTDHNVLRLQVAIADILRVQVLKDGDYLCTIENSLLKIKMLD